MVPDTGEKNALLSLKGKLEPGAFWYYTIMVVNTKTRKGCGSKQQCLEKANYVYNTILLGIHGYCIALHYPLVLTGAES